MTAAWRAAGFGGPALDLLSCVRSGEGRTISGLVESVRQCQRPEDVARGLGSLQAAGYIPRDGDTLRLTPRGMEARDRIEADTDHVSFAPWPLLSQEDIAWLRSTLEAIIRGFPS